MASGRYEGRALVELLDDGRRVRLKSPFAYIDPGGTRWDVKEEAIVDGASIPRALWTLIGGPFEGKYRNASIIHDWYCDLRLRPWQQVHRMFFDAMITSAVSVATAKLMYAGVYFGGPRWSTTVVENTALATGTHAQMFRSPDGGDGYGSGFVARKVRTKKTVTVVRKYQMREADLSWLSDQIKDPSQSLDAIESTVDQRLASRTPRERRI